MENGHCHWSEIETHDKISNNHRDGHFFIPRPDSPPTNVIYEAIMEQDHYRPLVPSPLLPEFSSHLHTVSRFLLSTAALLPVPRLRMGCIPIPVDAIRVRSPVLVLCSRVALAAVL